MGCKPPVFEHAPFLRREVEEFIIADRQWHKELIRESQKDMKQSPLAEVNRNHPVGTACRISA